MDSILTSTKKILGILEDYTQFDPDIIIHINSVFSILTQLGVGPKTGFFISDKEAKWSDYLDNVLTLEMVKTYMALRVRLLFDPPINSSVIASIEKTISELEWRLNVEAESKGDFEDISGDPRHPRPMEWSTL